MDGDWGGGGGQGRRGAGGWGGGGWGWGGPGGRARCRPFHGLSDGEGKVSAVVARQRREPLYPLMTPLPPLLSSSSFFSPRPPPFPLDGARAQPPVTRTPHLALAPLVGPTDHSPPPRPRCLALVWGERRPPARIIMIGDDPGSATRRPPAQSRTCAPPPRRRPATGSGSSACRGLQPCPSVPSTPLSPPPRVSPPAPAPQTDDPPLSTPRRVTLLRRPPHPPPRPAPLLSFQTRGHGCRPAATSCPPVGGRCPPSPPSTAP